MLFRASDQLIDASRTDVQALALCNRMKRCDIDTIEEAPWTAESQRVYDLHLHAQDMHARCVKLNRRARKGFELVRESVFCSRLSYAARGMRVQAGGGGSSAETTGEAVPAKPAEPGSQDAVPAVVHCQGPPPTMQAALRVIANFATQHLRAAALFRDQVAQIETENVGQTFGAFFEDVQSYGSACIMSSTAALEALINELFIAHGSKLRALLGDFDTKFWGQDPRGRDGIERKSVLKKYQRALSMLGVPTLDERSSPFRDAWGLVGLRNALVHYKPTWDPDRQRPVDLAEVLAGRFALSPYSDSGADFVTIQCMSAGCARWAVETVVVFVREFESRGQLDAKKIEVFLSAGS